VYLAATHRNGGCAGVAHRAATAGAPLPTLKAKNS
jgi:hypothetical protein